MRCDCVVVHHPNDVAYCHHIFILLDGHHGHDRVIFSVIHLMLVAGTEQALRAKIEALVARLQPEQALLEEQVSKRILIRQAHDESLASVGEAQAALARFELRKVEMDQILGDVRQQLEDIRKALLKLTKADLDELRRMPDPPVPIRRTLEMVREDGAKREGDSRIRVCTKGECKCTNFTSSPRSCAISK